MERKGNSNEPRSARSAGQPIKGTQSVQKRGKMEHFRPKAGDDSPEPGFLRRVTLHHILQGLAHAVEVAVEREGLEHRLAERW